MFLCCKRCHLQNKYQNTVKGHDTIIIDDYRLFETKDMPVTKYDVLYTLAPRRGDNHHFSSVYANNDRWVIYLNKIV